MKLANLFILVLVSSFSPGLASAQTPPVPSHPPDGIDVPSAVSTRAHLELENSMATEKLHVIVGQSIVLHGTAPLRRIYIGNPAVLQTFNGGPSETVLTAKQPGISSLVLWDDEGRSCLYTVSADLDPASLREAIKNAYPGTVVEANGLEDRITLSGVVPSAEVSDGVAKLAANYTKDVVNSLRVVPGPG